MPIFASVMRISAWLGEEVDHDLASASCKDSIMVQKRVEVRW